MSNKKRNIKKQHKKTMVRVQTIIFTLFGSYIIHREGEIWVGSLIKLLKPFGLSENAIRLALSRMTRQGLLQSRKAGRRSYYSLTEKGHEWMLGGQHWTLDRDYKPWDKKWRLFIYNIPEELRHLRDALRKKLFGIGYGSLSSSVWISPYDLKEELAKIFDNIKVADYVETFEAKYGGLKEAKKLAAKVWDIRGLENRYVEFLNTYSPLFAAYRERVKRKDAIDPGECFAERFQLTAEYIDIALDDPMLPFELLPADWAGLAAKKICLEYRNLLTPEANKFVDSILKNDKP